MKFLAALLALAASNGTVAAQPVDRVPVVRTLRVPDRGIQPQAVMAADGTLHLLYYKGDPQAGDLYYVTRAPGKADFSAPTRVNSQPGSAVAIGNDRGGQIALGKNNRPHIAWNGSGKAEPKGPKSPAFSAENPSNGVPMLYSRLNEVGDAFEPQRNVITSSFGLDGGGGIAAFADGHVFVVFHADPAGATSKSETERRVFVVESSNNGANFAPERILSGPDLGACGCCGLKALVNSQGKLRILFRSAQEGGQSRNTILLSGELAVDQHFGPDRVLDRWRTSSCPMTTASMACAAATLICAWETAGQVYLVSGASFTEGGPAKVAPPGEGGSRKYPSVAVNGRGQTLLAWTEGMRWGQGGSTHWQLFDMDPKPIEGACGQAGPVPAWSLIAAVAEPDGSFDVLY